MSQKAQNPDYRLQLENDIEYVLTTADGPFSRREGIHALLANPDLIVTDVAGLAAAICLTADAGHAEPDCPLTEWSRRKAAAISRCTQRG